MINLNMLEHIVKAFLKALSPNNIQICVSHISRVEKLGKIVKYYVLSQKFSATLYVQVLYVLLTHTVLTRAAWVRNNKRFHLKIIMNTHCFLMVVLHQSFL